MKRFAWLRTKREDTPERTPGGSAILRHAQVQNTGGMEGQVSPYYEELEAFFNGAFPGRETFVWHEIISDRVHIDVYSMAPTPQQPYFVLYTVGMSALPMSLKGVPHAGRYGYLQRAELVAYLPADWPLEQLQGPDTPEEAVYWPVRLLKGLARMPHRYDTWLGAGHSVPNGEPMRPYDASTGFSGAVLYFPDEGNGPQCLLPVATKDGGQVMLYVVVPVYPGEMEYKLEKGADALEERLRALPGWQGFLISNDRPDTSCKKKEDAGT